MKPLYILGFFFLGLLIVACSQLPEECQNQNDPYDRDYCILTHALQNNVSAHCDKISNEHWQTWCYMDVAANTLDANVCEKLSGAEKEHCIKNIGISLQDVKTCQSIRETPAGDECFRAVATSLKDATLCTDIAELDTKNKCFVDLAGELQEYLLCTYVEQDTFRRDSCLFRTSLKANATEGCAEIFVPDTRDICYVNHAIKKLDAKICDNIADSGMEGSCRAAVKLAKERKATNE